MPLLSALLGAGAGLLGWGVYSLTDLRPLAWLLPGLAVGFLSGRRRVLGALLGGGAVLGGLFLGELMRYPMFAWAFLGGVLGWWVSKGLKGTVVGFLVGLLSVHLLPLLTFFLLPLLGLPTTFDYDVEGTAMVLGAAALGAVVPLLRR